MITFIRLWSSATTLEITREEQLKIQERINTIQRHLESTLNRVMKLPLTREGVGEIPMDVTAIGSQGVLQPSLH